MTYDNLQKYKDDVKHKDRITMDWMILLAIIFHLAVLHVIIPEFSSQKKWAGKDTKFIDMARFKPPPPPEEKKPEEIKKKKKKKVLAKPIPQKIDDEVDPMELEDEDIELVYDSDDIDFDEPEAPPEGPLRVGGDVNAPVIVKRVDPIYPDIARRTRIQGLVILEAIINKDGEVVDVKVLKSLNSFCDDAAVEAAKQWIFEPGTQNDIPVDVVMTLTVQFRLK